MGRPRIQDELDPFRGWLIDLGYNGSTVKSYTSIMRNIMHTLGRSIAEQQAVDDFFHEAWANPSYGNFRTAWKLFREWVLEVQGYQLPAAPDRRTRLGREVGGKSSLTTEPLPSAVRRAIRQLRDVSRLTVRQILRLTWDDVNLKELTERAAYVHITDARHQRTHWSVRSVTIGPLHEYAQPGSRLSAPLVPRSSGADQPYPYNLMICELKEYTEEELDARRAGVYLPGDEPITADELRGSWKQPNSSPKTHGPPGSALGSVNQMGDSDPVEDRRKLLNLIGAPLDESVRKELELAELMKFNPNEDDELPPEPESEPEN